MTGEEYKVFPLEVFREHIQQEKQSCLETLYWLAWKAKKSVSENDQDAGWKFIWDDG
jgi:hypothetical protein